MRNNYLERLQLSTWIHNILAISTEISDRAQAQFFNSNDGTVLVKEYDQHAASAQIASFLQEGMA